MRIFWLTCLGLAFLSTASFAADETTATVQALQVIGRVNVAGIALVHGAKGEALAHVKSAADTADGFPAKGSIAPAGDFPFARLSFHTYEGDKDYFIPLSQGDLVTSVFEDKFLRARAPEVQVTDADVVRATIEADPAAVKKQLAAVVQSLTAGKAEDARIALEAISDSAVSQKRIAPPPLDRARSNLMLARALLRDRAIRAAGFAVGHARGAIVTAQQADPALKGDAGMNRLEEDMNALADLIGDGHAASIRRAEGMFPGLFKKINAFAERSPTYN